MAKIVVANLKMNLKLDEIKNYVNKVKGINDQNFIISPTSIYIPYFLNHNYQVAVQNCYFEKEGAFTGEIGIDQIKSLAINYVIIGHSERRAYFNEDDLMIKKKVDAALKENLKVILCVGENLVERENKETLLKLKKQINILEKTENIIIAYEPIWAIGTGIEAKSDDIFEAVTFIKTLVDVPVLYGGSVNINNIEMLNKIDNVDGFLVGTAAKNVEEMIEILRVVR